MFERIKLNLWFISNQSTTTRQQPKQSYLILSWLLCFPLPAAAKSVFPFPLEFKISEKAHDELLSCCSPTEPLVATEAPSRHLNLLPIQSSSVAVSFLWKILWNHFPSFDFHNMGLGPWKLDIFIFNILLVQKLFQDSSFSVIVLFEEKMGFILWLILRQGALSSFHSAHPTGLAESISGNGVCACVCM